MNFIGGEDVDVTILCVEDRGNTKLWLAELGAFCEEVGRNDVDTDAACGGGFEEAEEEDEESILLVVDFALGIEDKGWKQEVKDINPF